MHRVPKSRPASRYHQWCVTLALALMVIATSTTPLGQSAEAAQFRRFTPIAKPAPPPEGFTRVATVEPLPRPLVEKAIRDFFAEWNGPSLSEHLSDKFFDKERLVDQIAISAPRDAEVRLLALRGVSTLGQFERADGDSSRILVSQVSAIAQTQVEFNSPAAGFVRLEGTHEYNFTITSRAATP